MTTIGQGLKVDGRDRSFRRATAADVDAFMGAVAAVPVGVEFSVNLVRHRLDAADVPPSARASLFARAAAVGLIEPVVERVRGREVQVTEPSSGVSAHNASVRVYRRLAPRPGGSP